MKTLKGVGAAALVLFCPLALSSVEGELAGTPGKVSEWRIWTDSNGNRIEAQIRKARPKHVEVVGRDGRVFSGRFEDFSEPDQIYIAQWVRENLPNAGTFRDLEYDRFDIPERYQIENVERQRPGAAEPLEPAAIKMIFDYHGIRYDENLTERIAVREIYRDRFIPPRDLVNTLKNIPVEAELIAISWDPYSRNHKEVWESARKMIKLAISMDLPVLVGYRPYMDIDTPELVGVAIGYEPRNLRIIEPAGSRHPGRFHLRDFEFMFTYAMVLIPTFEPALPAVEQIRIEADFLNRISAAIRETPEWDPLFLTELFREKGIEASVQDVNRTDFHNLLGRTRSFAREGGLPLIDIALDNGRVVVVPQEFRHTKGFALIYGRVDGNRFATVEFFPDRTFERRTVSRRDLALRWVNRVNRTYRLDLIQIPVPREAKAPPSERHPPEDPLSHPPPLD